MSTMTEVNKVQKRVVLDMDLCISCKACRIACSISHHGRNNLVEAHAMESAVLPYHCRHCEDPNCVASCPKEALEVGEDGIVRRHMARCIGCKSCIIGCPFGAIQPGLIHRINNKCDLCQDRTTEGKEPRCVSTCTSGALSFVDVGDVMNKNLYGARILGKPGPRRT